MIDTEPIATPSWTNVGEAVRLSFRPRTLRRTLVIAAIVGTLLSVINQGDVMMRGDATTVTWLRIAANYVVPFCVSTAGFLSATRTR